MICYRIYTEDINRDSVQEVLGQRFGSYTIITAEGHWHGIVERSIIIEILESANRSSDIQAVADLIRFSNNQDAILVTETEIARNHLIEKGE